MAYFEPRAATYHFRDIRENNAKSTPKISKIWTRLRDPPKRETFCLQPVVQSFTAIGCSATKKSITTHKQEVKVI